MALTGPRIAAMPGLVSFNKPYNENPARGLLRSAAGPAGCTAAAGPGAALALQAVPCHTVAEVVRLAAASGAPRYW